jgi:Na+/H+-dicarboxylate symporter
MQLDSASTGSALSFALSRAWKSTALTTILLVPPLVFSALCSLGISVLYRSTVKALPRGRVLGYLLGFSAFGACLGLLAGWPKEPLIDKLLSPFLAFFTGFMAYLTNKETSEELRNLAPGAVIAFLLCVLFSYAYLRFY